MIEKNDKNYEITSFACSTLFFINQKDQVSFPEKKTSDSVIKCIHILTGI
jgi:hypothetical protein